ncbi:MAG: SHD1 domain-containing protein, partial [Lacipirellulaceae bacterium]
MLRHNQLPVTSLRLAGALVLCLLFVPGTQARTWSDKSGKQKVEAEFLEYANGKVELRKSDGTTVKVPLSKLSKDDQRYVRDLVKGQSGGGTTSGSKNGNSRSFSYSYSTRTNNGNTTTERSVTFGSGNAAKEDKPKPRTWVDSTGKHKIRATFMELVDGKVRLRREDNKVISFPLDKLSERDQEEVKRLSQGVSLGDSDPDNPFGNSSIDMEFAAAPVKREPGEYLKGDIIEVESFGELKRGTVISADGHWLKVMFDGEDDIDSVSRNSRSLRMIRADPNAVARSASGQVLSKADFSSVEQVVLGTQTSGSFIPDPGLDSGSSRRLRAMRLGGKKGFFEDIESFTVSPNGEFALVSRMGGSGVHSK